MARTRYHLNRMAHSRRKTPVRGITSSPSDKEDKVAAHRRERRVVRVTMHIESEREILPATRELGDPWAMAKDGKTRFDPKKHPRLMRK